MNRNFVTGIRTRQHWAVLFVYDILTIWLFSIASLWIRFDFSFGSINPVYLGSVKKYIIINMILTILIFHLFRLYTKLWRYAVMRDAVSIMLAVAISSAVQCLGMTILSLEIPRSYFIIYTLLFLLSTIISRFLWRIVDEVKVFFRGGKTSPDSVPVLLYGAGEAGQIILKEIQNSQHVDRAIPCIIDDDPKKKGTYLMGVPVIGGRDKLEECVHEYDIQEIIIAIPSLMNGGRKQLLEACNRTGCKLSTLPGIYQLINQDINMAALREVNIEDLLGRAPIETNLDAVSDYLKGKTILVTGGGGSIGSELCRQIAGFSPKQLIVLDNYENNAYSLQVELLKEHPDLGLAVVIASVQDENRIHEIFSIYKPDLVYHAAAHKHVPLMEASPNEAIKNNVFGTAIVAKEADLSGAEKFVMISTDKAVRPTNIMGASKRICEMIVQTYNRHSKTEYVAVRFGNVLGSNGSVVPLFKKQIAQGGPVTVTHPDIIRYFMTITEAVSLVLQAGAFANGGEIFILDMGEPVKILDMAKNLICLSGYVPEDEIEIVFTGLRPGEKLYEELLMDEEKTETANKRIFVGQAIPLDEKFLMDMMDELHRAAYSGEKNICQIVKQLVPEYTAQGNQAETGASPEKDISFQIHTAKESLI